MTLFIVSFLAGVLTVAAPCILPLLPVIIGGSLVDDDLADSKGSKAKPERQWLRPLVIATSLAVSVVVFTMLIKATTALLGVPQVVWQVVSGSLVILIGIYFLWPRFWIEISSRTRFFTGSNVALGKASNVSGVGGDVLTGAALGPVFSSCSPTYALIVATVLPASFAQGFAYLVAYAIGMSATLLVVAYLGRAAVQKMGWLSNPNGWLKRAVGIIFITVGLVVMFGLDKKIQSYVLEQGWYDPISNLEKRLTD